MSGIRDTLMGQTYDIFSGLKDKEPLWLESVVGYDAAYEQMLEIAFGKPGSYFVFCTSTNCVICAVDTSMMAD